MNNSLKTVFLDDKISLKKYCEGNNVSLSEVEDLIQKHVQIYGTFDARHLIADEETNLQYN